MKNTADSIVLQLSVNIKLEIVLIRRTGKQRCNNSFLNPGSDTMLQLVNDYSLTFVDF